MLRPNIKLFFSPDEGAGGGTPEAAAPEAAGQPEAAPEKQAPAKLAKFASQLSPELREKYKKELSEDYADKSLNDAWSELMDSRGRLSRAVIIPNPKDEDQERFKAEYKTFLEKMGIPDKPDGYEIKADKMFDKAFMDNFKLRALKSGLTKTQAQAQMDDLSALAKQGLTNVQENKKKAEEGLLPTLKKALHDDEGEVEKTMNLAKKYLVRMGDKDLLQQIADSGLMYNAKFIMKAAEHEKAMGDPKFIDGKGQAGSTATKPKGTFGNNYSNDFNSRYGGKK